MPTVLRQDVQLARLISRIERGATRVKQLTHHLTEDALFWRPPDGGWSIAHFLEHATTSAQPYLGKLPPVIKKSRRRHRFAANGKWNLSLAGGILQWTAGSERGVGSSPWFTKMPVPDPNVLTQFHATQARIADMFRSADGLSLGSIYCWLGGPAVWRLADCFTLLVARTERDVAGARTVREHPDYPIPLPAPRGAQRR